jgi:hypothetical protein
MDNAANILGLMGADLLHSIEGSGYDTISKNIDTSMWPSAEVTKHACVDLANLQSVANFTELNSLLYTAGEPVEDALGLSYLGCSANANTRYREDASVWCSVGMSEEGRCTAGNPTPTHQHPLTLHSPHSLTPHPPATHHHLPQTSPHPHLSPHLSTGLADFSFSCDEFKCNSDKVLNCRGPSQEQLGYYSRKCSCTVEWWVPPPSLTHHPLSPHHPLTHPLNSPPTHTTHTHTIHYAGGSTLASFTSSWHGRSSSAATSLDW